MANKKNLNSEVKPYGLNTIFETVVAELATSRPSFWGRVGHEIDPERIIDKASAIVLRACKAIAHNGRAPTAPAIVLQRIQSWFEQGKIDASDLACAAELCKAAMEDAAGFDEESVISELAPALRRALEHTALESGLQSFGKRGSLDQAEKLLARAKRIGCADVSLGSRLSAGAVHGIVERSNVTRFSTGIQPLDFEIGGGVKRGTMTILTGSTGTGKSMFVDHFVANAISNKEPSAIATLELSEEDHYARIIGNLVDIPYSDILSYPDSEAEAAKRMAILEQDGLLAFCTCKYFTAGATTVADIEAWLEAEEQAHGVKISVLGLDYAQLLSASAKKARHEEMSDIAKDLRALAVKRQLWLISPNQANGEGMDARKTKVLQNHHSAESKGIPKNADLHITLNQRDDGATILWHVAKNRYGITGSDVGPLPHVFEKGRCIDVFRKGWPF